MNELDKERARFVTEILRISEKLGKLNITQADYMAEYGTELSLAALSGRAKWRFNELKVAAGMTVNKLGGHPRGKVVKPEVSTKKKTKRPCNKCEKLFVRTPKNRIICSTCVTQNMKITEGSEIEYF